MQKETLFDFLAQNRFTCSFAFDAVTVENSRLRLNEQTASVGFIYRHVGEIMLMYGTFFGVPAGVENTTMGFTDTGQPYDVQASSNLVAQGYALLESIIENTADANWQDPIETPFFGTVSRARLLGHVLFHNSHHAGQIALTLKRGTRTAADR